MFVHIRENIDRKDRGSTTIETVIWLPVLLMLIACIFQYGLIMNGRNAVQAACFEAARQAALADDPEQAAKSVVNGFADGTLPGWGQSGIVRTEVEMPEGGDPGCPVKVEVEYDVPVFIGNLVPGLQSNNGLATIKGSAEMIIEEKP